MCHPQRARLSLPTVTFRQNDLYLQLLRTQGFLSFFFFFSFLVLLGLHLRHMEIPRLGVESELQLPACIYHSHSNARSVTYTTAHGQRWILNPLSEARDGTCILTDASQIRFG